MEGIAHVKEDFSRILRALSVIHHSAKEGEQGNARVLRFV
jgi:hypothetical protein